MLKFFPYLDEEFEEYVSTDGDSIAQDEEQIDNNGNNFNYPFNSFKSGKEFEKSDRLGVTSTVMSGLASTSNFGSNNPNGNGLPGSNYPGWASKPNKVFSESEIIKEFLKKVI